MKRFMKSCSVDLRLVPFSGLYALRSCGEIVYIGQSNNILRRVGEHRAKGEIRFDSFLYIRCDVKKERDKLECHWISHYKPRYNQQHNYTHYNPY